MTIWQMETLDGWEEVMMINTLGCSNYGYWAKIVAGVNDTSTLTTDLQVDPFWEVDQMAFECKPQDSRGLGWLAVMFCVSVVLLGGMVLPTVLIGVISLGFDEAALKIKLENKEKCALEHITRAAAKWPNGRVTSRQMECMRTIFRTIDFDSQGDITRNEFIPFLDMLCSRFELQGFNDAILNDMFDVVDVSGDGSLSFPEFCWLMLFLKYQSGRDRSLDVAEENKTLDCTIDAAVEVVQLGDEETKTADEETKTSDEETKTLAQTTQLIYEAAVWLDDDIGDGLSDGEDAIDDEDGNDAGDDVDPTTGRAVDCTTVCQKRISPSVEPPLRDFDDESFANLINVLQPLAGVASGLQPAADRISDPRARAGLLSLLVQLTSLPAMPREDLQTLLQRTDIVPQAITATGHPPRRPASSRKQRAGRRGLKKKNTSEHHSTKKGPAS